MEVMRREEDTVEVEWFDEAEVAKKGMDPRTRQGRSGAGARA
jgi:hypothetical protein